MFQVIKLGTKGKGIDVGLFKTNRKAHHY